MKRFCRECGKEVVPGAMACANCGTRQEIEQEPKPKTSKKKRLIIISIISILVVTIGFSAWAIKYQGEAAVEKRFNKALVERNVGDLRTLMIHQDGKELRKMEVEAFVKLEKDEIDSLYEVKENGKFLGLFTKRKIAVVSQYAVYNDSVKGLEFLFNEMKPSVVSKDNSRVVFGPLAPGVYDVKAEFSGKYGQTSKSEELTLADSYGEETDIEMDVPVSKVVFNVQNIDQFDTEKAYILLNKEKIKLNNSGETKEIGPIIIDKSQKVQVVVQMPWGEVKSREVPVMEKRMEMNADLISEEQYEEVEKTLKSYGEHYVEALATKDEGKLSNMSDEVKRPIIRMMNIDECYTGKFELLNLDRESIDIETEDGKLFLEIAVKFQFSDAYHEITDKPELNSRSTQQLATLLYNDKEKKWTIQSMNEDFGYHNFNEEVQGSNKEFGPSKEAIKKAEEASIKEEMTSFIENYTYASVDAINYNDFQEVESYIDPAGPRYKESKEYVDYLYEKGITEEWLGTEIEKVESEGEDSWKVTAVEEFTIYKEDSAEDKKYRTVVIVKRIDGEFKVHKLVETNPI